MIEAVLPHTRRAIETGQHLGPSLEHKQWRLAGIRTVSQRTVQFKPLYKDPLLCDKKSRRDWVHLDFSESLVLLNAFLLCSLAYMFSKKCCTKEQSNLLLPSNVSIRLQNSNLTEFLLQPPYLSDSCQACCHPSAHEGTPDLKPMLTYASAFHHYHTNCAWLP